MTYQTNTNSHREEAIFNGKFSQSSFRKFSFFGDAKDCNIVVISAYFEPKIFEPPHDKTNKMACAPSEDTDQPGHPPSLIILRCLHKESLGP